MIDYKSYKIQILEEDHGNRIVLGVMVYDETQWPVYEVHHEMQLDRCRKITGSTSPQIAFVHRPCGAAG